VKFHVAARGLYSMSGPSLPEGINAEHLTGALRAAGALSGGRVREVAVESTQNTILSQIVRLRVTYEGAAGGAPAKLILKTCHPERVETFSFAGRAEVKFYRDIAPQMPQGSVPRCFDAQHDETTKRWHLLLDDLSATHMIATAWPIPPDTAQCEALVAALARVHAAWWNDARVSRRIDTVPDAEFFGKFVERFARFRERFGDRLSQERCDFYSRLLDQAPRLSARFKHGQITIVHGDAHAWNFLLPRTGAGAACVFDWDSWRGGIGSDDLAYMIALHWYPERRARLESHLLDHYHEALLANGVKDYSREALRDDYRLSTLFHSLTPVGQAWVDIPPVIWWNHFERIMMAVDDLGCRELLD
jgi:hypothetical protein